MNGIGLGKLVCSGGGFCPKVTKVFCGEINVLLLLLLVMSCVSLYYSEIKIERHFSTYTVFFFNVTVFANI